MLAAIVRSWKNPKAVEQVKFLLAQQKINYVIVAINADIQNQGEENGEYTSKLLREIFGSDSRLIIYPITNWGKNPGSATALNEAVSELFYRLKRLPTEKDIILNISVESKIKPKAIKQALRLFEQIENVAVVGVKRKIMIGESRGEKELAKKLRTGLQYRVPQNTVAFWRANLLRSVGGFRTECDSTGTIIKIEGDEIPVAGMEDFPTLVFLVRLGYKWVLLEDNPMIWDLEGVKQDEVRWKHNLKKINRQETVMGIWSQKYFNLTLEQILSILKNGEVS